MKAQSILILTGRSGSGKSTAVAALEDAGFYCVDNLPVALLPLFLAQYTDSVGDAAGLAFVMDLREKNFVSRYAEIFEGLRSQGYCFEIIYLEADENILRQRYSQTRRHHPLARGKSLLAGIRAEKEILKTLRRDADRVIDTSLCNVHELRSIILDIAEKRVQPAPMRLQVMSFGFKFGVPPEADLIIDVRFLPNPFFEPRLRDLDGTAPEIHRYLMQAPVTAEFMGKYLDLLDFLMPLYEKEGKAYLTVAVGCTGGRHRSVAIAQALFSHFDRTGLQVNISHRDIDQ